MSRARTTDFPRVEPLLLLAVIVLILYFARDLLIPLTFALTLAFLLTPAVSRLETRRVPRVLAVALVGILAFSAIGGVGYVVTRQLLNVARTLPAYRLNIKAKMATVHSPAEQSVEKAITDFEDITGLAISSLTPVSTTDAQQIPAQIQTVRVIDPERSQLQATTELLMRFLRPIGTVGVVIVFTIYLLMKREDLRHRILLLAGMGRISLMTQALQEAATRISQYLFFQAAVNASYGILFGSGLYLIGIPDATLWGALAGILRVVPYVGTATSLALPLIVSIAISASWWHPLLILGLFLILELSATNFVEPWLFSSRTGISSLALLTMAIFWALLWGMARPHPLHTTYRLHRRHRPPRPADVLPPHPPRHRRRTLRRGPLLRTPPRHGSARGPRHRQQLPRRQAPWSRSTTPSSFPPSRSSSRTATRATSTTPAATSSSSASANS